MSKNSNNSCMTRIAMIVVGLILILLAGDGFYQGYKVKNYIKTDCTIERSEIKLYERTTSEGKEKAYKPLVIYNYSVNGKKFKSSKYYIQDENSTEEWAKSCIKEYPVNSKSFCYYDPENPQIAVLKKDTFAGKNIFFAVIGVVLFFVGLV